MITKPLAMRDALLEKIWIEMAQDAKIFFVSADFGSPVLDKIRRDFPDRFVNVGIAEQNLINVSVGLSLEGYKVFSYAIAPFITMRCYEQIRVSLALLSTVRPLNVNLIGVGAGYSYVVSGPTHQCYEDITLMRAMPTMRVLSAADHVTAQAFLRECIDNLGPKYLRFDAQVLPVVYEVDPPEMGQGFHVHATGKDICLVATGFMLHTARTVANQLAQLGYQVGIVDMFKLSHFDSEALKNLLAGYSKIVTLEEGFKGRGGLDAMVFDFLAQHDIPAKVLNIGVDGQYRFDLGSRQELHEQVGIGAQVVRRKVMNFITSH